MEIEIKQITELFKKMNSLSEKYTENNSVTIQHIYNDFGRIVDALYKENGNRWYGLMNGYSHTGTHIHTLSHSSPIRHKIDAYKWTHEQLKDDIQEVFDRFTTKD